ncbi:MAG: DHH family phosphoesterase [Clostridiales Family XIII bacterium]|jgi:phosphoglycolate phosphatase|nr:DHH family phosphoesterase [Clostridiales Family XIII bacterium]
MDIGTLAAHRHIVIQCHDVPDADAIGAGFALQCRLRSLGANPALVYGGRAEISKPNLVMMLEALQIEIAHAQDLPPETDLLITVDCQRGAGNVQYFELSESAEVFVIDHHRAEIPEGEHTLIRPALASCATLVRDLIDAEDFSAAEDYRVCNALCYGLFTDTNGFSELRHPLDRDLAELPYDAALIRKLNNSSVTREELSVIGETLKNQEIIENIGLFRSAPCDPNLLGFASDIAKQVVGLDACVVYCEQPGQGLKLSVRSSAREIMSDEFAAFLCRDAGSGGGSIEKAGGFLSFKRMDEASGGLPADAYLRRRIRDYIGNYEHIHAGKHTIDFAAFPLFAKRARPIGFANSTDVFPAGTKITVRTLEGDVDTVAGDGVCLMIGILGEVYPILRERFEKSYTALGEPYDVHLEYVPAVIDRVTGERRPILPFASACLPRGEKLVRATPLERDTKVFSYWDLEKYFHGTRGDFLVANEGDYGDCYIVRRGIFLESYELHEGGAYGQA